MTPLKALAKPFELIGSQVILCAREQHIEQALALMFLLVNFIGFAQQPHLSELRKSKNISAYSLPTSARPARQ